MSHPAQQFIDEHVAKVKSLSKDLGIAYWDAAITGSEEHSKRRAELDAQLTRIYANPEEFARLRGWRAEGIGDELLARQVDELYRAYLANQKDDETIDKMVALESQAELTYANYRGEFEGEGRSNNDLRRVLSDETDSDRCRAAWEASKAIGPEVCDTVLALVRLRNETARKAGYADYYHLAMECQELDVEVLFGLLDDLEQQTREPFARAKAKLDAFLAKRFELDVADLRPWHYGDFFFQEAPANDDVDLSPFFSDKDIVKLATDTFDGIGLETRGVLERSDLLPKDGKDQHAFCTDIDREGDVRVLCNLVQDEYWMNTLLHELGHGVYDAYLDPELPWLLREPAHTLMTEAVAMIMGRLTKDEYWLRNVAGIPAGDLASVLPHIDEYTRLTMLIFVRWCLVMIYFERDLYANPEQDLNTLWWDYVERFQMLSRPENRASPDWAAKIHVALAPVYYHNYLLGEMLASQMDGYVRGSVHEHGVVGSEEVGAFFREGLFDEGARRPWNDTIEALTGEPLTPTHFARQFVEEG